MRDIINNCTSWAESIQEIQWQISPEQGEDLAGNIISEAIYQVSRRFKVSYDYVVGCVKVPRAQWLEGGLFIFNAHYDNTTNYIALYELVEIKDAQNIFIREVLPSSFKRRNEPDANFNCLISVKFEWFKVQGLLYARHTLDDLRGKLCSI